MEKCCGSHFVFCDAANDTFNSGCQLVEYRRGKEVEPVEHILMSVKEYYY